MSLHETNKIAIDVDNVTKRYAEVTALKNVSLSIHDNEFFTLLGPSGCGKSTFMKILTGELAPSAGNVSIDQGERLGVLSQNQYAFEEFSVLDAVIMGDAPLWAIKQERDRIYSLPEMTEEDGMKVADLETEFAELDGYTAESRAGELLIEAGIDESSHWGLMSQLPPGVKLRVLLVQALFANPDILLLDEPTNNLDIYTINWLADVLNQRKCTMIIISHDRHFLNKVCTHMADIDYTKNYTV